MSTPSSPTGAALAALGTRTPPATSSFAQRTVDGVTGWLAKRTSRRGFLVRAGVVGSALAVDPKGYVLRPGTAYASVCGPGAYFDAGWTVFCATINNGVNACPPGSVTAGWWKMTGASLCGGGSRYIIDCNATCRCTTAGTRPGICSTSCQSCGCSHAPSGTCDDRRVCCNQFRYGQCNDQIAQVGAVHCRVVSCTPPWVFDNCTTASFTDQATVDHNSDKLPTRFTTITRRYIALGENGSKLGASVYGEVTITGGAYQRYQYGRISWSSATGPRETAGAIGRRYLALNAEGGRLGFPTTYETPTTGGAYQGFQHGRISWSSPTGAWETLGSVGVRYSALGFERGALGFPLSGETATGAGVYQRFEHGRISWSAATGAHEVRGAIGTRFLALGAEVGPLGFPATSEGDAAGGRYQGFQRGRISWTSSTGAHATYGAILARYTAVGLEAGVLGFPTTDETVAVGGAGRFNDFTGGRISWSNTTGAHWMGRGIAAAYRDLGAEGGSLGLPVTDETVVSADATHAERRRVVFQGGTLTYEPGAGVTRT